MPPKPMQPPQALHQLAHDSLVTTMPDGVLARFREAVSVRQVEASTVVARQGQSADKLIIPVDHSLRIVKRGAGDAVTNAQLRAHRALNLGQVLGGGAWEYSAFADVTMHLVEVDAAVFREILEQEPGYATYLQRMTARPSMRTAAHVLRRNGLEPAAAQRVLMLLEEHVVPAGQAIKLERESPWVLVDRGAVAMLHDEAGAKIEIGTLAPGEFYGGAALLGRARSFELVASEPSVVFAIAPRALRMLCAQADNIARAISLDHPAVQLRVRRAFVESGQGFTEAMAIPIEAMIEAAADSSMQMPADDDLIDASTEIVTHRAPIEVGKPWVPGGSLGRRLEGFRCGVADDTGAAALASLLKFLDRPATYASVRRSLVHRTPPSFLDLARVAERHDLMTHASTIARPRDLAQVKTPFLLAHGEEILVVNEVHRRSVRVFSPLSGLREIAMAELDKNWSGAVLAFTDVRDFVKAFARKDDDDETKQKEVTTLPKKGAGRGPYFKLFTDSRGPLYAALLLSATLLGLSIVGPRLSGLVIDQVLVYGDAGLLTTVTIGMLLLQFVSFLLGGFRDLCITYLTGLMEYRLSSLTLRYTLGVALDAHGEDRVGSSIARLDELRRVRSLLSTDIIQMVLQSAQALVFLLLVFTYSAKLGLLVLGAVPIAYLLLRIIGRRSRALQMELFDEHARLQSQTTEQVEQIATIKALGGGPAAQKRWEKTVIGKLMIDKKASRLTVLLVGLLDIIEEGVKIATMYVAVRMLLGGELSAGETFAVSSFAAGALAPLVDLANKLDEFAQVGASFRKLEDLYRHPMEDSDSAAAGPGNLFEGAITAKNLEFAYDDDGPLVLRNINFEIEAGQTVAIVGRSGSGKSTLAKILHGALRPTGGELMFDEQDSRSMSLPTIRSQVGIVLQDSHLFAGSIRDNIAYGDDRPDEKRIQESARLAAAHEFIGRFPAQYDTFLAEGGLGLSGGQRQRISIARALYRSPRILVMDEATSALDGESERLILENMREILRGRTGLVIAHRLNTVKNADKILVIDDGEIVESGTHDELVAKRGLYHSLFDRQFHQS